MTSLTSLINSLFDKNNTVACGAMKILADLSEQSDEAYECMDTFAEKDYLSLVIGCFDIMVVN